jgi:hypothetical protein
MGWNARAAILIFGFSVAFALPMFAQDFVIHEIPPAMNLLTEIPIAQGNSAVSNQGQGAQGQAKAQQNQSRPNEDQPSHSQADTNSLPQVETFTGTIGKGSDGYFLKGANGAQYRLDDATKAQPFDGKNVQISGKLELDTNLIHVESIKPAQ